jgi:hypothetical protein
MAFEQDESIIETVLNELANVKPSYGDLVYAPIFDSERHHYQVLVQGWLNDRYHCQIIVHIELKNDFVWLQQDLTDANIAEQLIEHGIPRERIVLGFQPPYKRGMHGFANGEIQDHAA